MKCRLKIARVIIKFPKSATTFLGKFRVFFHLFKRIIFLKNSHVFAVFLPPPPIIAQI